MYIYSCCDYSVYLYIEPREVVCHGMHYPPLYCDIKLLSLRSQMSKCAIAIATVMNSVFLFFLCVCVYSVKSPTINQIHNDVKWSHTFWIKKLPYQTWYRSTSVELQLVMFIIKNALANVLLLLCVVHS